MIEEKFEIFLDEDYFIKGDVLNVQNEVQVKVISTPKRHYSKWYWKVLNFMSFKLWFNEKCTYTVEVIN